MELPDGLVAEITGCPDAEPYDVVTEPVDYQLGTPTTESLVRLRGKARRPGGESDDWSVFVKRIQSTRH